MVPSSSCCPSWLRLQKVASLKSLDKVNQAPYLIPAQFEWGNFAKAVTAAPFEQYYFNSVVMTV